MLLLLLVLCLFISTAIPYSIVIGVRTIVFNDPNIIRDQGILFGVMEKITMKYQATRKISIRLRDLRALLNSSRPSGENVCETTEKSSVDKFLEMIAVNVGDEPTYFRGHAVLKSRAN